LFYREKGISGIEDAGISIQAWKIKERGNQQREKTNQPHPANILKNGILKSTKMIIGQILLMIPTLVNNYLHASMAF
jgi:hypothetical protein